MAARRKKHTAKTPPDRGSAPPSTPGQAVSPRGEALWAIGTALLVLAVYLLTLPPSITFEDSGELVTAAATLGIAHPPGYPLHTMLGHLFTWLPFGPSVAWKVNLFSAVTTAVAAGLLFLVARRLGLSRPVAAATCLLVAWSRTLWSQSLVAEVYALNALFLVLVLLLGLRFLERRSTGAFVLLAVAFGLGFGNHFLLGLVGPGIALWLLLADPPAVLRPGRILAGIGAFLATFLVYLYLPVRSGMDPVLDWGNPETFDNLLYMFQRKQFAGADVEEGVTFLERLRYLAFLGEQVAWREMGVLALPLALVGVWRLWNRHRPLLVGTLLMVALNTLGLVFHFLAFHYQPSRVFVFRVYPIGAWLLVGLWAGVGLHEVAEQLGRRLPRPAVLGLVLLVPLSALLWSFGANDLRESDLARRHAAAILATLPEDAILLGVQNDVDLFPLLYAQVVEGERPDVLLLDDFGLVFNRFEGRPLLDRVIRTRAEREAWRQEVRKLARAQPGRPVFHMSRRSAGKAEVRPVGLLLQEVRPGVPPHDVDFEALYGEVLSLAPEEVKNHMGHHVAGTYHLLHGLQLFREGDEEGAETALARARAFAVRQPELLARMHLELNRAGRFQEAEEVLARRLELEPWDAEVVRLDDCFSRIEHLGRAGDGQGIEHELRRALEIRPGYAPAILQLGELLYERGTTLGREGKHGAARDALLEARRLGRQPARALCLAGVCRVELGEVEEGLRDMKRAAREAPRDLMILKNLARILTGKGRREEAREVWRQVLAVAPEDPEARRALGR